MFNSYTMQKSLCNANGILVYSLDFEALVDLNQIQHLMRTKKLAKKDVDSIFMYFETSIEDLTVLKKYDICLEECIDSVTNKVHALFGRLVVGIYVMGYDVLFRHMCDWALCVTYFAGHSN